LKYCESQIMDIMLIRWHFFLLWVWWQLKSVLEAKLTIYFSSYAECLESCINIWLLCIIVIIFPFLINNFFINNNHNHSIWSLVILKVFHFSLKMYCQINYTHWMSTNFFISYYMILFFEINVTIIQYLMLALILQNLCVTAADRPIKEILEKEKKECLFFKLLLCLV